MTENIPVVDGALPTRRSLRLAREEEDRNTQLLAIVPPAKPLRPSRPEGLGRRSATMPVLVTEEPVSKATQAPLAPVIPQLAKNTPEASTKPASQALPAREEKLKDKSGVSIESFMNPLSEVAPIVNLDAMLSMGATTPIAIHSNIQTTPETVIQKSETQTAEAQKVETFDGLVSEDAISPDTVGTNAVDANDAWENVLVGNNYEEWKHVVKSMNPRKHESRVIRSIFADEELGSLYTMDRAVKVKKSFYLDKEAIHKRVEEIVGNLLTGIEVTSNNLAPKGSG